LTGLVDENDLPTFMKEEEGESGKSENADAEGDEENGDDDDEEEGGDAEDDESLFIDL